MHRHIRVRYRHRAHCRVRVRHTPHLRSLGAQRHHRRFRRQHRRFCRLCRFFRLRRAQGQVRHRVCGAQHQVQIRLLLRLRIRSQQDLTGGDLQPRFFLRLFLCLAVSQQPSQNTPGLLLFFLIPAGHLCRHIHHTGAEKVAETFLLSSAVSLRCAVPVIIFLWHPCRPSCSHSGVVQRYTFWAARWDWISYRMMPAATETL